MADNLDRLLNYIVEHRIVQNESREAQMDATAVQDIGAEIAAVTQDERERAQRLAPYFASGLRAAAHGSLTVDDTTEDGSNTAEALASFLVVSQLATSQSQSIDDGHFRYTFDVNWPLLREVARVAGVDLNAALSGRE